MKDIIEQLEEGKRNQENSDIDKESLYTQIGESIEEKDSTINEKPKRKLRESKKELEESVCLDPFAQAKEIINQAKNESTKESIKEEKKKNLVDPDFDFADYYEKFDKIYFIRIHEKLGIKDLLELKIRTIYPRFLVTIEDKKACVCIGYNEKDFIFINKKEAIKAYNKIHVKTVTYTSDLDTSEYVSKEPEELINETDSSKE